MQVAALYFVMNEHALNSIPAEIHAKIIKMLPMHDIARLSQVSTLNRHIAYANGYDEEAYDYCADPLWAFLNKVNVRGNSFISVATQAMPTFVAQLNTAYARREYVKNMLDELAEEERLRQEM